MRKENLILCFLFVLLQCQIGHAVKCYSCIDDCQKRNTIECGADEQCMTREYRVGGNVQRQQKGCLRSQECNASLSDPSLTQTCCNTDLCNGIHTFPTTNSTGGIGQPGSPLICKSCDYFGCLIKSDITCNPGERCLTQNATIAQMPLKKYGCASAKICSTTTTEVLAGFSVSVGNMCCEKNLCNYAVTLKLPFIAAIGAVLLLWITNLS
ncbi:uncharacterized protein [Pyxicephalus adspersus]|uniref:uncharacterized protein n=1 Tax=Pyxicephalus adspersus TaxID=30357 RepID=UPI003B5C6013